MGTWHDFCHIHTIHGSTNFWSNYHCAAGTPCWTSDQVVKHTADKLVSHVRALARPMISPYGHLSTARANLRMAVTSCNPVSAVLMQQWNVHFLKLRNFIHRYRWKGIPHRFIFSAQLHTHDFAKNIHPQRCTLEAIPTKITKIYVGKRHPWTENVALAPPRLGVSTQPTVEVARHPTG